MTRTVDAESSVTFDASGASWGRLASKVATTLRGKHRVHFTPNILPRVMVVVKNIKAANITARDRAELHYHFSGYPGGLKSERFGVQFDRNPGIAFTKTVRAMLPPNRQRDRILKHLKVL
jgi:large subunit ribosomal protein L13